MFKLKNNRTVIVIFAVIMVLSVVAIYIPLLFPPQSPQAQTSVPSDQTLPPVSPPAQTSTPTSSTPNEKVNKPSTSTTNLPSSLQGLQNDENTLNDLQNSLGK